MTVVSYGFWQRRLGASRSAIGEALIINGQPHTVVAVLPPDFQFRAPCDIYRPMREGEGYWRPRRFHNWLLVGRLKPGITIVVAQSQADAISARLEKDYPDSNRNKGLLLTKLQDAMAENSRLGILVLMAAIAAVLLIACANVASLLLARGLARRRELAIRAALGASRLRLVRQLLTESVAAAIAAGILGLLLAMWLQRLILAYLPLQVPVGGGSRLSGPLLLFALGLTLATGLLFGIAPALRGAGAEVLQDLRIGARTADSPRGAKFRSVLVVVQVAISVVLLVCSGLLIRSFTRLRKVDPGFQSQNLLTFEVELPSRTYSEPKQRIQFFTALRDKILAIPGVRAVGVINQLPILNPGNNIYVHDPEHPPTDSRLSQSAYQRIVLPGYFETLGIPLLAGRDIQETDQDGSPRVLVISREMADGLFPNQNPLGRRVVVDLGEPAVFEVVGIVGDVHASGLAGAPRWAMYGAFRQRPYSIMRLAVQTQVHSAAVVGALRKAVRELDKDIPVAEIADMETVIGRSIAGARVTTSLLSLFAGSALLLAVMGLYGVLAYYVSQRRQEIGLRIALGAGGRRIMSQVLSRGIGLVLIGLVFGLAGSLATTRLLATMLFNTEPTDAGTFAAVSIFFVFTALVACLIPAWRALRVDPVIALQSEYRSRSRRIQPNEFQSRPSDSLSFAKTPAALKRLTFRTSGPDTSWP